MKPENLPEKIDEKIVENLIYEIRGMQVMLDSDVAFFFQVETKIVNKAMKRNQNRFPEDFCFQLKVEEKKVLRCQNGTANSLSSKRRYNPYVYTEHGIIALAGIVKSDVAAKASVEISRKFVEMRKTLRNMFSIDSQNQRRPAEKRIGKLIQTPSKTVILPVIWLKPSKRLTKRGSQTEL